MGIHRYREAERRSAKMKGESPLAIIFSIALGALCTLVVRQYLANKNRRLKDFRKKIDSVCSEIDGVEDLSMAYFLKKGADDAAQAESLKIKAKLSRIAQTINGIHKDVNLNAQTHDRSLLTLLKNFRQSITLDDFDSLDREPLKASDSRFGRISDAAGKLKQRLEDMYSVQK
jgi:hypothetical protein